MQADNEFLFVTHKAYDQDLDIESSAMQNFKIRIPERIVPGNQKVLDVRMINKDETGFGDQMVVLSRRDSNMFYHVVNP